MKLLIDIILLCIIVGFTVVGFRKGFVKMAISCLKNIVAFLVASAFSSKLGAWLKEQFFMEKARVAVEKKVAEFLGAESATGADIAPLLDSEHAEFVKFIEKLGFDVDSVRASLQNADGTVNEAVGEYIVEPCVSAVSNVIAFIALFVATLLVLWIVSLILSFVTKLPVLKVTNRFFGGVLGLVLGVFIAFLSTALIRVVIPYFSDAVVVSSLEEGTTLYNAIRSVMPAFFSKIIS